MKSRESRKLDHIRYALCVGDGPCASGFSDVHLLHHCLSGICRNEVDLTCLLPGLPGSGPSDYHQCHHRRGRRGRKNQ